jgi:hypothetical protein
VPVRASPLDESAEGLPRLGSGDLGSTGLRAGAREGDQADRREAESAEVRRGAVPVRASPLDES